MERREGGEKEVEGRVEDIRRERGEEEGGG